MFTLPSDGSGCVIQLQGFVKNVLWIASCSFECRLATFSKRAASDCHLQAKLNLSRPFKSFSETPFSIARHHLKHPPTAETDNMLIQPPSTTTIFFTAESTAVTFDPIFGMKLDSAFKIHVVVLLGTLEPSRVYWLLWQC